MLDRLWERESLWDRLSASPRPVVLYGMGDGADKVLAAMEQYGIPAAGVFASPGFTRGHSYRGFPVRTLAETEAALSGFTVLLCFASQRPQVMELIQSVEARHPLFAPDLPVCGGGLFTPALVEKHRAKIEAADELWADQLSRQTYRDVLSYKISGKLHYLLRCTSSREEVFHHLIRPGEREIFVDAGAYTGDTVAELLGHTGGRYRRILALEPDRRNHRRLTAALELLPGEVTAHRLAAWSGAANLEFSHSSGRQAEVLGEWGATPAQSIDNLLAGDPATIIKLDVEGSERPALEGCRETIARHRPRLMVAAYHRNTDLWDLPLQIHALHPGYRLYLRHHPYIPAWETNLYAI